MRGSLFCWNYNTHASSDSFQMPNWLSTTRGKIITCVGGTFTCLRYFFQASLKVEKHKHCYFRENFTWRGLIYFTSKNGKSVYMINIATWTTGKPLIFIIYIFLFRIKTEIHSEIANARNKILLINALLCPSNKAITVYIYTNFRKISFARKFILLKLQHSREFRLFSNA